MSANIKMVAADLTKWIAWGTVGVKRITAYNPNGATVYIQLMQTPTVAAAQVPAIASLAVPSLTEVAFEYTSELVLSELFVALSSTEASYTAVGAGAGLDMNLIVDSDFLVTSTTTIVGDLTSAGVASLVVWSNAAGAAAPKRLLRVDVKNSSGAISYTFVSANVASNAILTPKIGPLKVAIGATGNFYFGRLGITPTESITNAGATIIRQGCEILNDDSPIMGGGNVASAATNWNIRAIYDV